MKHKNSKIFNGLILVVGVLLIAAQAQALLITTSTTPQWTGNDTSMNVIEGIIADIMSPYGTSVPELYKQDVGGAESGLLKDNYTTVLAAGNESATITYDGGDIVGPTAFLLVKDGNSAPAWYLFNLTALQWNGTELIEIQNFWTGTRGEISHVSLYGNAAPVPEPTTLLLFGTGLLGLAAIGRRKS